MIEEDLEVVFKIIVVGDSGCGKTSVVRQYVDHVFSSQYQASIGLHFAQKSLELDENKLVKLQLWDIAGQDRFREMTHVYYKNAVGAVVVCDVTRPKTWEGAIKWREDISAKLDNIPVLLLANKSDLLDKTTSSELGLQLDEFCRQHKFDAWYLTSAKENTNLSQAFEALSRKLLDAATGAAAATTSASRVVIDDRPAKSGTGSGPCSSC